MARVIAVANQKGGVGKTTTVINLGAALARLGQRTLMVDLDPQAALSAAYGLKPYQLSKTIYNALVSPDQHHLTTLIHNVRPNLDLVPANIDLAAAEVELISALGREYILREVLTPVLDDYDFILIDTPPSLGLLTVNSLAAATEVLIPLQCEYLAMRGMGTLLATVKKIQAEINPRLKLLGILGTMYDGRTIHSREVLSEIQKIFGDKVFDVVIGKSIRFAEAPVANQPIIEYDSRHDGAKAYLTLAEVIVHGKKESQPGRARS